MKVKKRKKELFDVINSFLVVLITFVVTYPLYFCVIASFSEPAQVSVGNTLLWVKDFTLEIYQSIFKNETIWVGYRNSIMYTVLGTSYNLIMTIPAAYVLSKTYLPFRQPLTWFFFLTMYISGGLIPTYLWLKELHLLNTPLVLIIGSGVSAYNLIITRQYFSNSIPSSIYEAAYIDGASEFRSFLQIACPLSKPIVAVMTLYYGVTHWNSYYNALIYIQNPKWRPLQLILRNILFEAQNISISDTTGAEEVVSLLRRMELAAGMKYGLIVIASIPLLVAYPFVQKHFTKGIMTGGVKG